jgi:hypothetical protein
MDEVFDSGVPPWRSHKIRSARLEHLAEELARDPKAVEAESDHITVPAPAGTEAKLAADVEKQV